MAGLELAGLGEWRFCGVGCMWLVVESLVTSVE